MLTVQCNRLSALSDCLVYFKSLVPECSEAAYIKTIGSPSRPQSGSPLTYSKAVHTFMGKEAELGLSAASSVMNRS